MSPTENQPKTSRYGQEIKFRVLRFNPEKDRRPYYQSYRLVLERGMTVLDALMQIKETQDPTLSYRKSCRMGICGSCAMYVNGLPYLACQTQVSELDSDLIVVRPLPNYPILRDVVPDLRSLFESHQAIKPYIIRQDTDEMDNPTGEFKQAPRELEDYLQFAYCIKCGACLAACPTCATDDRFTGPQALAAAYRYQVDSRDDGFEERAATEAVDGKNGLWRCHFAGACSEACPKGVDPALGIQLLKRKILARRVGGKQTAPAQLAETPTDSRPQNDIPKAPPPTVKS
ncbi:MAG: succinate dehydrogenase iron-sulfur subunit [Candidatus Glassbacteria bacterium]|nr:succinate dehydrogenase iron-sulfur subunit [Candidatus Glassbacteria bacterium]